ncbi:MAG TPA: CoA transferase [Actinobacteria bacterium]|nr:CoA transferase [Actinomycetota bacterium]
MTMKTWEVATSMHAHAEKHRALGGVRVLDLSSLYAAPLVSTNLADFGADVIKVEHPRGDDARRWGLSRDGVPLWWRSLSRNKRLLTLDLNDAGARSIIRQLVADADVVIENFRPGKMESWGLGYDELSLINPRVIMVRLSGFGQTGPRRMQPGFGTLAEAYSGFAHVTGQEDGPPTLPPFGLADGVAGLTATFATLIALYWRDANRGGVGQVIDVSLYEPLFCILGPQIAEYAALGAVQRRVGNRSPRTAPRNAYETSDGHWVALSAGTQAIAVRIFRAIGRPDLAADPRFSDAASRRLHGPVLDEVIATWMRSHSLSEVLASFAEADAPIAPVLSTDQIYLDEHYRARQTFIEIPDDELGSVAMANIVPRLSRTPGSIRHTGATAIGSDTTQIVESLERNASAWADHAAEEQP